MRTASALLALATLSACGPRQPPGDTGVAGRISAAIERRDGSTLDMEDVAPFAWDRFCAFPPYTTEQVAEQALGFDWTYAWSGVEQLDDRTSLVFVNQNHVVSAFDYGRRRGDFSGLELPCMDRAHARFVAAEAGVSATGEPRVVLRQVR